MGGVFISYRRENDAGFAGRIADVLVSAFGADAVFRDIDDITPGADFVAALRQQLARVELIVVVIGPTWLMASRDGVRRIDAADDFVRMEIESGLRAGKALLPVLVGGAKMPSANELPPTIGALARHQALVVSDASWAPDTERLVASIRPVIGHRRPARAPYALALAAAIVAIALIVLTVSQRADAPGAVNGRWIARVNYDWGASHEERFVLRVERGQIQGSASYLGTARSIVGGQLDKDRLTFVTHSQEMLGDAPSREVTHRYRGAIENDELHLVLESGGGYSAHPPLDFVARRATP